MEQKVTVIYYPTTQDENPVSDFLDSLSEIQQTKILRVLTYMKEYGISSVLPHVKKLTGTPLWEIRILGKNNIRVLYVMPTRQEVLVLHGFIKKKQKTPLKETNTAIARLTDWQNRQKAS